MTSHLPDEFSNHQVRLSREIPIHFATTIFFLSEFEYKYLALKVCIKQKHVFQLGFFTSMGSVTQSCLRKKVWGVLRKNEYLYEQYYTEIWTWGHLLLDSEGLFLCYVLVCFSFMLLLDDKPGFSLCTDLWKVWEKEVIWRVNEFLPEFVWAHSYTAWMMYSIQRYRVPLGTFVLEFLYH